ncbi:MAG: hypothetical protein IID41_08380 [Planctomycetes bacterium]|nr:hypothetical protein [Planctomycetota bacterium]
MTVGPVTHNQYKVAILVGQVFLLAGILTEAVAIGIMNSGHFTYTLDDAYIHLALSENIHNGHYGINSNEFSSPSSSILWPFLLSPLASAQYAHLLPLFINLLSAVGTVFCFCAILNRAILAESARTKSIIMSIFVILLILGTNTIGLVFTGMEHSMQLLLVTVILWGLINEIESQRASPWLACTILIAPLIRYEDLSVSVAALLYLLARRYYRLFAALAAALMLSIGAFSGFLLKLNLEVFPASVLVKSSVVSGGGHPAALLSNFKDNIGNDRGMLLVVGLLFLGSFALLSNRKSEHKLLAGCIAIAVFLHLVVGRHGWYNRYEVYIWSVTILTILYLSKERLAECLRLNRGRTGPLKVACLAGAGIGLTCAPYIFHLGTIPLASNNIYEQQYQMYRFAAEYYRQPIAVNDVGYVSYRNSNYVLDLWGLGSLDALKRRKDGDHVGWMNEVARDHNVRLAMIYEDWFEEVPAEWRKVGEMELGKRRIAIAGSVVSFYALDDHTYNVAHMLLAEFRETLPAGVGLTLTE